MLREDFEFILLPSVHKHYQKKQKSWNKFLFFHLLKSIGLFLIKKINKFDLKVLKKTEKNTYDFLFVSLEHNHLDQQKPLADKLSQLGYSTIFMDISEKLTNRILEAGVNSIKPIKTNQKISFLEKLKLLNKLIYVTGSISKKLTISYLRTFSIVISFAGLIAELLFIYEKLFNELKINKGLLVGYDIPLNGRLCSFLAKNKGIKVTCIMHGTLSDLYKSYEPAVNNLFLFGENDLKNVKIWNLKVNTKVTGSAAIDTLKMEASRSIHQLLNIPDDKKLILVASSGPGDSVSITGHKHFIQGLSTVINQHKKDCFFVIKLHMKDNFSYYRELDQKVENYQIIDYNESNILSTNVFEWLSGVDLLITGASTVGIEAQVVGVPCISFDPERELLNKFYIAENDCIYCDNTSLLTILLNNMVKGEVKIDPTRVNELESKYFYKVDGMAATRMAEGLLENKMLCAE